MRRRASRLGSVAFVVALSVAASGTRAGEASVAAAGGSVLLPGLAVPPLSAAEAQAAFAPVAPGAAGRPVAAPAIETTAALAARETVAVDPSPSIAAAMPATARPFNEAELAAARARPEVAAADMVRAAPADTSAEVGPSPRPDKAAPSRMQAAITPADPAPMPTVPQPVTAEPAPPAPASVAPAADPAAPAALPAAPAAASDPAAEPSTPAPTVASELAARFDAAPKDKTLQAIAAFYALRGDAPAWTDAGTLTPYARTGLDRLSRAAEDGLDPRAFQTPAVDALAGPGTEPGKIADAEIAVASAFLTYARQAANGRVDARAISRSIVPSANAVDPALTLASIAIAADPAAVLDGFNPVHPQFVALRRKLAELRAEDAALADSQPPRVPPGPTLKIGMADARVAVLRSRLGLTMSDGDVFDDALAEAVRSFQKQRRLKATGTVGPQTVAALNGGLQRSRVSLEDEIVANMERWRWLPRDVGTSNVLVNIPEYRLRVTIDGQPAADSKVIVGKPGTPTPIFSDTMEFVVLNPSWNVPQSIIKNEYLPKLMDDPDYLAKRGFVVTYRGNQMSVRQPPGDDNALGHIKFMFPNNFSVYLHDTSSRNLFSSERRAFSHGCVRVDNPYDFAEIVMGAENGWTADKVRGAIGGRERRVDLKRKLPVHIAYFTAYVDESGDLQLFDDIYGYDQRVLGALGLAG